VSDFGLWIAEEMSGTVKDSQELSNVVKRWGVKSVGFRISGHAKGGCAWAHCGFLISDGGRSSRQYGVGSRE